jgi:hypothetical protein
MSFDDDWKVITRIDQLTCFNRILHHDKTTMESIEARIDRALVSNLTVLLTIA